MNVIYLEPIHLKPSGRKGLVPAIYLPMHILSISLSYMHPPTFVSMEYFNRLLQLLKIEKEEDRLAYKKLTENIPLPERREMGVTWFPIAIKDTEVGRGDYLTLDVERTSHQHLIHQLRFGMSVALFSNYDAAINRLEGTISYINGNRLKISLRTDELPDWTRNGRLGVDAVFDENSYSEMEAALKTAAALTLKNGEDKIVKILTGEKDPTFHRQPDLFKSAALNGKQQEAVNTILEAGELAIVHGPPGTGKTTTLVKAIEMMWQREHQQILVVAPSNTAVDLLTEKLFEEGLTVVRIGNPARVSEHLMETTLDNKIAAHPRFKDIKKLKKQAGEYRNMAQKYKRNFGKEEREQRKALFIEARNIQKEVERTEQYIVDDILSKAAVLTATLVGANHYTVRQKKYNTVVIDEAGQALEPACWIPILKAKKVVMAGDHLQLPPIIKSAQAAREGLSNTLLEKCVALHPEAVVLLEEQYRMHQMIMEFPSQAFYSSRLIAHETVKNHLLFSDDEPLTFIDTAGCGFDEKIQGTSISNPEEAAFLIKQLMFFVAQLMAHYPPENFPSIAVISPYKHQVDVLRELVLASEELKKYVAVNTIDSFQGQERDAVFISMTRSNSENNIGFLSELRRMNVAMTRARKKLVVVGDSATLSQHSFYANFIAYADQNKAYKSAWELMDVS